MKVVSILNFKSNKKNLFQLIHLIKTILMNKKKGKTQDLTVIYSRAKISRLRRTIVQSKLAMGLALKITMGKQKRCE